MPELILSDTRPPLLRFARLAPILSFLLEQTEEDDKRASRGLYLRPAWYADSFPDSSPGQLLFFRCRILFDSSPFSGDATPL